MRRPTRLDIIDSEGSIFNMIEGAKIFFEDHDFVNTECRQGYSDSLEMVYLYRNKASGNLTEIFTTDVLYPYCCIRQTGSTLFYDIPEKTEYIERLRVHLNQSVAEDQITKLYQSSRRSIFPNFVSVLY